MYSECGKKKETISLIEHIFECEKNGAGEIFINSIDQDGMMNGYDIDLIKQVAKSCGLPIIACGGAGNFNHMKEVIIGLSKHVKRNGAICLDIGDSIYAKTHIPTHEILSEIAANNNLVKKDEIVLRKRHSNDGTELSQRLLVFINEK